MTRNVPNPNQVGCNPNRNPDPKLNLSPDQNLTLAHELVKVQLIILHKRNYGEMKATYQQ